MKTPDYEAITNSIIADLEKGTPVWIQPWNNIGGGLPYNAESMRSYNGINILIAWSAQTKYGYSSSGWLTFRQAKKLGGYVRKGEKSTRVYFASKFTKQDDDGEDQDVWFLKPYSVFNIDQIESLPPFYYTNPEPVSDYLRNSRLEDFIHAIPADVQFGGNKACFIPNRDVIRMPRIEQFTDVDTYYSTLVHELVHWSGHADRLDRDLSTDFGSESYVMKEMVAELGSAFICADLGVAGHLQHSEYISHWIKVLKDDPKAILTAARKASQAANALRDYVEQQKLKKVA